MPKDNDREQLQKVHEPMTIEVRHEPVHAEEHAAPLAEQVQPVMVQVPLQDQAQNQALLQRAHEEIPIAEVRQTAPGTPIQEEAPPQLGWKARQREKRHAKAARKLCPVGTAATYDMVASLQDQATRQRNAAADNEATMRAGQVQVDNRLMETFAKGYRVDKKNRPVSPEDAQNKAADAAFYADYCSGDLQRRRPHLERMVNETLAIRFTPQMFSQRNLRSELGQMKKYGDMLVYLENAMHDPINRPFFEQLDPTRLDRIRALNETIYEPYISAIAKTTEAQGVDLNMARYYNDMDVIQGAQEVAQPMVQTFQNALPLHAQRAAQLEARQAQWVSDAAMDYAQRFRRGQAALNRVKADPRLGLQADEAHSAFLTRAVMLMDPAEDALEENLRTVQTTLAIGRLKEARPDEALYRQAKELLAPRVQRVLDCDVEPLLNLTDEALLLRSGELNAMFMDTMFVSDLIKTKHHCQSWAEGAITLQDDIVGQRSNEFAYKQNILRGLAERARGLAMQRQSKAAPLGNDHLATTELQKIGQNSLDDFASQRIEIGNRIIDNAKRQWAAVRTPGTPEFQEWINLIMERRADQRNVAPDEYYAVSRELSESTDPVVQSAMLRVRDNRYCSIAHTQAEMRENKIPADTGEAVFRSFLGYIAIEALKATLTPAQFRQMVLDLGAGYGMHKGSWEFEHVSQITHEDGTITSEMVTDILPPTPEAELNAAVEANKRGIDTFKRVLHAKVETFERKYGSSLEHLTLQDYVDHYEDFARDFGDSQVPLSMLHNHPDVLDPNDPDDQLLQQRVDYYCIIGPAVLGLSVLLQSGAVKTDEEVQAFIQMGLTHADFIRGRANIVARNEAFAQQTTIDWSQKPHVTVSPAGE